MCDNDDGEAVVRVKAGLLPQLIAMEEEGEEADEAAVEAVARAAAATLARDGARKAAAVEARAKKVAQEEARIAAAAVEGGSPRRRLAHGRQPPPPPPAEGDASPKQPSLPRPRSRRPSEEEEAAASPKPEELAAQGVAAAVTAAALEAELGTPPRGGTELAVAPAERAEEAGRHRRGLRRQLGMLKQAEVTARTPAAEAAEVVGAKMEPKAEAAAAAAAEAAAWPIDPRAVEQFCTMFAEACAAQGPGVDRLGKAQAGAVLTSSGLPTQLLLQIWSLADVDGDDQLDLRE